MSFKAAARNLLSRIPAADVRFRRRVWSRWHFPEPEMRFLHELSGQPIDVAIDVGAAMGGYAWILNRKARRVIAFEPGETHASFLERGLSGTRIELVRAAVGAKPGMASMFTPGSDTDALHSATLAAHNPAAQAQDVAVTQVPQVTIDHFVDERLSPDERLDFIKVDVEGYEQRVFDGAVETIAHHHPLVLCEIEARHNPEYGRTFELLRSMGYVAYVLRDRRFERFDETDISCVQRDEDLKVRLGPSYRPGHSAYINNFTFEHPQSRIKVSR